MFLAFCTKLVLFVLQIPAKIIHESAISCHFLKKNALFAKFFVRLESLLDIFGMETRDWREKLAGNEAKNRTKNSQKLLKNSNVR